MLNKPRPAWHQVAQNLAPISLSALAKRFHVTKMAAHNALLSDEDYVKRREKNRNLMRQLRGSKLNGERHETCSSNDRPSTRGVCPQCGCKL